MAHQPDLVQLNPSDDAVAVEALRFAPDILRRLGEELIPHAEQGILELVRNAYDADASECVVELPPGGAPGGTIVVHDNGTGMTAEDLIKGWLVLGRSRKDTHERTALGRLQVGNKGLGRLAALRLGTEVEVVTRPQSEPGVEYHLVIDWTKYDGVDLVDEVPLTVTRRQSLETPGTRIEMRNVRGALDGRDARRLSRALLLLSDPFESVQQFRARLVAPGFEQFEALVRAGYFPEASFHLLARLDKNGRATGDVLDWKGQVLFSAGSDRIGGKERVYAAPPATFEMWTYRLSGSEFTSRSVTLQEVRHWLKAVGGIHLYHRDLRVYPYGDEGHDWLELNLARTRSPEERPSTNNTIGRVVVEDPNGILVQKTDRSGFIENHAFEELRHFAKDALTWMASERLQQAEKRREAARIVAPSSVAKAQEAVQEAVSKLPPKRREVMRAAVLKLEKAQEKQTRSLREEVDLYRALSTVGTTAAVFAHEGAHPVTRITKVAEQIVHVAQERLKADVQRQILKAAGIILTAAQRLQVYASVPFALLNREKRRPGFVDVNKVIRETEEMFRPFFEYYKIKVDLDLAEERLGIQGTVAATEAIVANLLSNAMRALTRESARLKGRRVVVRTQKEGADLILDVLDNGPGIRDLTLAEIWLPGKTTQENGTGLGLTIVRDAVADLGGRVHAEAEGELGGAEFSIRLPVLP